MKKTKHIKLYEDQSSEQIVNISKKELDILLSFCELSNKNELSHLVELMNTFDISYNDYSKYIQKLENAGFYSYSIKKPYNADFSADLVYAVSIYKEYNTFIIGNGNDDVFDYVFVGPQTGIDVSDEDALVILEDYLSSEGSLSNADEVRLFCAWKSIENEGWSTENVMKKLKSEKPEYLKYLVQLGYITQNDIDRLNKADKYKGVIKF